ncbi:MAG: hypothetical protein ABGZ17_07690, partial [Planctomycetaceae bacterium]
SLCVLDERLPEAEANERLIKAAPDMLAVIEGALRISSLWACSWEPPHDEECKALHDMKAAFENAITKATGEPT